MAKSDLINALKEQSGISKKEAAFVVETFFEGKKKRDRRIIDVTNSIMIYGCENKQAPVFNEP